MLTLRSAADLLGAAHSLDALEPVAAAAGFRGAPLSLDATTRGALGLGALARDARIITGAGTLRALLVLAEPGAPLRDRITAIAGRLAARAPHLLWLVAAAGAEDVALAAWQPDERGRPRIAALIAHRARVSPSDAETLRALAGASEAADLLTHALWLEVLGRDALTRRFYRALEGTVSSLAAGAIGRANEEDRRALAILDLSRLLFLVFLEAKGWLDGDPRFLEHRFDGCMERGGHFHRRVLLPLFFGTLNTPPRQRAAAARAQGRIPFLNGGLFARTPLERRVKLIFPDDALGAVLGGLLLRYRFTAREDTASWSEAAIDPEMLGKAFESLMSSRERRNSGAFYTPQPIVAAVTRAALASALRGGGVPAGAADRALGGDAVPAAARAALRARLREVRLLDPACGSGAFLVHALETMSGLAARLGDARPVAEIRREFLTRAIFGVDVNPTAVWLCELRLWLSVVIESGERDPSAVPPLPNLDRNIRVGDALSGPAFAGERLAPRGGAPIERLRERYARATGVRKRTLHRALDRAERALALAHLDAAASHNRAGRRDLITALRGRDLFGDRVRPTRDDAAHLAAARAAGRAIAAARRSLAAGGALPFNWLTHFPHIPARGGFDAIIGNPPWVRLHRIPPAARAVLRERFAVFRAAAWERGAAAARAGAGFAAQVDLASLFVERSMELLRDGGTLALLLPAKLWRSLAGGGLRRLLAERAVVLALEDWTESPHAFDAAVYPSLLVARRREGGARADAPAVEAAVHGKHGTLRWPIAARRLALDGDPASPWIALPTPVRDAFDRIARAGTPLASSPFGPPLLGVKCGCNDAFVVTLAGGVNGLAEVRSGEHRGAIERAMLRPLLRGEHVTPWSAEGPAEFMIWTHGRDGAPLARLPVHAAHWFSHWRRDLLRRSDARHAQAWWSLFRIASAHADLTRIVWADMGRAPRALILPPGDTTVALNSCYVLPCADPRDAAALAALLNSPLAAAWLGAIAEPARGGYKRFLAWTVSLLPLPRDWPRARAILAPLADRAIEHDDVDAGALLDAAVRAYRLRRADLDPLLAWNAR